MHAAIAALSNDKACSRTPAILVGVLFTCFECTITFKLYNNVKCHIIIFISPKKLLNWLRKKNFGMYSGLSAGVMFLSLSANENAKKADPNAEDETLVSFMFQATALGMEFGSPTFRGFVEAGLGEKGLFCAGLRYKF